MQLLGPDDAQDDPYLLEYFVSEPQNNNAPVVIGGWGVGKTAFLLKKSQSILKFIHETSHFSEEIRRIWYIDETDLNIVEISESFKGIDVDEIRQAESLYKSWDAEIKRRLILQLYAIDEILDAKFQSSHWSKIRSLRQIERMDISVWDKLLEIIRSTHSAAETVIDLFASFSDLLSDKVHGAINSCVRDLYEGGYATPIVLVEPVERPSTLSGDADKFVNLIMTVLLDLWYDKYRPQKIGNYLKVYLSVPWHRYQSASPRFPHRFGAYTFNLRWDRQSLKKIIEERLSWQAAQFSMPKAPASNDLSRSWEDYFPVGVENQKVRNWPNKYENSFTYVLRHTCWRPRDVIAICRACLERHCALTKTEIGVFFRSKGTVYEGTIREVVAEKAREIANWRLLEFDRKYANGSSIEDVFMGMNSPIDYDLFFSKTALFQDVTNAQGNQSLISQLWDSDIIGVCVEVFQESQLKLLEASYGSAVIRKDFKNLSRGDGDVLGVLFLYRYNSPAGENLRSIVAKYARNAKIIVHPIFHEKFAIEASIDYPIGV